MTYAIHALSSVSIATVNKMNPRERMSLAAVKHNTGNSCSANVLLLHFVITSIKLQ